ncbi:MAG: hypothetical protein ACPKPY_03335 [Nitrososphaeraceae archaeon]
MDNPHFWLWICIEPVQRLLGIHISEGRNMFVGVLSNLLYPNMKDI